MNTARIYRGIEDVVIPEIEKDETVEKLIRHLEGFCFEKILSAKKREKLMESASVLNPSQILAVSRHLKKMSNYSDTQDYLRNLIHISYLFGNNDFIIDNQEKHVDSICAEGGVIEELKITYLSQINQLQNVYSSSHIICEENVNLTGYNKNWFVELKKDLDILTLRNTFNTKYKIRGKLKEIWGLDDRRYSNIKLILNPEEYEKWHQKLKENKEITLEMIK